MQKCLILLLLSIQLLIAQQNSNQGVKIFYLPKELKEKKEGLKVNDRVVFYAGFAIQQEKILLGVDRFIAELDRQWRKTGKSKDFWKVSAKKIQQKTRGVSIEPISISEKGPTYKVIVWRKNAKKTQQEEIHLSLLSGQFISIAKQKAQQEEKAIKVYLRAQEAFKRADYDKSIELYHQSLEICQEIQLIPAIATNLNDIGLVYQKQQLHHEALKYFEAALKLFHQIQDLRAVATTLNNLGLVYQSKGLPEKALKNYQKAFQYFERTKDKLSMVGTLNNSGSIYQHLGKYEKALETYLNSLQIAKELNDYKGIAVALNALGIIYKDQGDLDKALNSFQLSLRLRRQLRDPFEIAIVLNNISTIYLEQGKFDEAISYLKDSLFIRREIGHLSGIALTLNNLAFLYQKRGNLEKALHLFKEASEIFQTQGNKEDLIKNLNNLGYIHRELGQIDLATKFYQKALQLTKETKDILGTSIVLNNLAKIHALQGNLKKALKLYKRSYEIMEKIGNTSHKALLLGNIAEIYMYQENFDLALTYSLKSLEISQKAENPSEIASGLVNIALIYQKLKKTELSLSYFQEALKINRKVGLPSAIGVCLNGIGKNCYYQKNFEEALEFYQQAYQIFEKTGESLRIANSLNTMAKIYMEQKNFPLAIEISQKALQISKKNKNTYGILDSLFDLGSNYLGRNKLESALPFFLEGYELSKEIDDSKQIFYNAFHLGFILAIKNQKKNAIKYYLEALQQLDKTVFFTRSLYKELIEDFFPFYQHIVEYLLVHHQGKEAFLGLQKFKAFGFLCKLTEMELELEKYTPSLLIKEKDYLTSQISALTKQILNYSSKENLTYKKLNTLKKQRVLKQKKLKELLEKIRLGNPAFATIKYPQYTTIEELQKNLTAKELFLEYFSTTSSDIIPSPVPIGGTTHCIVIGKTFFKVFKVGLTLKINNKIERFRPLILQSNKQEAVDLYYAEAFDLYKMLLKPAFEGTKNLKIKTLIIAPDEKLNLLPFDALCFPQIDPKSYGELQYVLDKYEISYTMSATVYTLNCKSELTKQRKPQALSFFGIGSPDYKEDNENKGQSLLNETQRRGLFASLPGTKKELLSISQLFAQENQKILIEEKAIEPSIFLEDLQKYNILHFATHGVIDTKNPKYSALVLTQLTPKNQRQFEQQLIAKKLDPQKCSDGLFNMDDIFSLHKKINADLVVLSACETALGKIEKGDGLVSLSRAFQFAGTPSVIVSLWSINDESTAYLMQYFYEELLKENSTILTNKKLPALHQAKQLLRHSAKYNAPYYWAPFILRGLK